MTRCGIVTTKLGDFDAGANTVLIVPDANTTTNPADYKIVAAGHTSTSGGNFNFALVRYNADGSLDTTFNTTGIVTTNFGQLDDIHDAVLQGDGKIVAVGSTFIGGKVELALARYSNDGSLDTSFGTAGQVCLSVARADLGENLKVKHVRPRDGKRKRHTQAAMIVILEMDAGRNVDHVWRAGSVREVQHAAVIQRRIHM
jgi:uncharacterized delta-60 repeat protein